MDEVGIQCYESNLSVSFTTNLLTCCRVDASRPIVGLAPSCGSGQVLMKSNALATSISASASFMAGRLRNFLAS